MSVHCASSGRFGRRGTHTFPLAGSGERFSFVYSDASLRAAYCQGHESQCTESEERIVACLPEHETDAVCLGHLQWMLSKRPTVKTTDRALPIVCWAKSSVFSSTIMDCRHACLNSFRGCTGRWLPLEEFFFLNRSIRHCRACRMQRLRLSRSCP